MLRRCAAAGVLISLLFCLLVSSAHAYGAVMRSGIIVFSARDLDLADLYVMDVERGTSVNVTRSPHLHENTPIWSPDGSYLLYNRMSPSGQTACVIQPFEALAPVCIDSPDTFVDHQGWSVDGQVYFAYLRNRYETYRVDPSTGTMLEQEPFRTNNWRSVSRDGRYQIILTADDRYQTLMVYEMTYSRSVPPRTIVRNALFSTAPVFSPDGTRIAFAAIWGDDPDIDIYTVNTSDGGDVRQLTLNERRLDEAPIWSPDGEQIVFVSDIEAGLRLGTNLYVMNADGSNMRRLTDNEMLYREPDWMP